MEEEVDLGWAEPEKPKRRRKAKTQTPDPESENETDDGTEARVSSSLLLSTDDRNIAWNS